MMIYCSLQVKFERTKPNGRIQRYGASIFGDIIIKVSKSINKEQQVFRRLQYIAENCLKIVYIKFRLNLPEVNGLTIEMHAPQTYGWRNWPPMWLQMSYTIYVY